MYSVGRIGAGGLRVAELLAGNGAFPALAGALLLLRLMLRRPRSLLIAASSGVALTLICVAIGAGKPAEFGRFLAWPALLLCVGLGVGIARLAAGRSGGLALAALALVVSLALTPTAATIRALASDAGGDTETRRLAALWLLAQLAPGEAIGVVQEPAPYCTPPLDFVQRPVVWVPPAPPSDASAAALPRFIVYCGDRAEDVAGAWWTRERALVSWSAPGLAGTPDLITWANKPVWIFGPR
jgi:hypothetical protein